MDKIERPFMAKDYELKGWEYTIPKRWEYTIPEGMEAFISDGKVVVRKKESEDERMRKALIETIDSIENFPNKGAAIAYLEKQKEPTFISDLPPDDKGEPGENGILEKQKDILSERAKNITINMLEDGIEGIQRELIEFLSNTINASWVDIIKSADAYAQRIRSMVEKQKPVIVDKSIGSPDYERGFKHGRDFQSEVDAKRTNKEKVVAYLMEKGYPVCTKGDIPSYEETFNLVKNAIEHAKEQKPVDFPTTDEEVKEFLETHSKVEVPEKYKTPDFVFSKQEYESHPIISKDTTSVKPAEWSEEDKEAFDMCIDAIPKAWKTKSGILLTKWLKDNIHLQSKQEWSKEEKDKLNSIERLIVNANAHGNYLIGDKEATDLQHFIRSIVKPTTNPAGWSEEDSKRYISIATALETSAVLSKEDYDTNMSWLRNLVYSQKYSRPQPQWKPSEVCYGVKGDPDPAGVWKPSEEQIRAIVEALKYLPNNKDEWIILDNLVGVLRKLM